VGNKIPLDIRLVNLKTVHW